MVSTRKQAAKQTLLERKHHKLWLALTMDQHIQLPDWLEAAGYARPPKLDVDPKITSVSRVVAMPEDWDKVGMHVHAGMSGINSHLCQCLYQSYIEIKLMFPVPHH